jgi:hypothetical protein
VSQAHVPENLNVLLKIALPLLRVAPDPRFTDKRTVTGPKNQKINIGVLGDKDGRLDVPETLTDA